MGPGLVIVRPEDAAHAVHAAIARLEAADVALETPFPALALLAAGRFERVRDALRAGPATDALPLVLARYVAWTGDLRTAAGLWEKARSAMDTLLAGGDDALKLATCAELASTATDLGDPQLAARLHGTARKLRDAGTVGISAAGDADVVHRFVHVALGAEPDATRHRLRLRPRVGGGLEVRQVRFGDGSVSLRVEVSGRGVSCVVEQDAGAIPATVLLEPVVAGSLVSATVDGKPAELAPRSHEGGTLVPVQLVLDEARTLELELG